MRIATVLALSAMLLPTLPMGAWAQRAIGTLHGHGRYHHRHHHHRRSAEKGILIPHYVPTVRPAADQLPPGTSRPGRSHYFVPPY